ncbi:hypothetical protein NLG97_g4390 [Lecanicillium saksenae]|uniref:Uncharacterized protein n=1 Tax=Lecanicillium saksenae TaxID=468837 RepID=A0ACC1QY29_9HYPO|nr:hypothetical protein NLG97_g4390 [Lecanicillium saksenae]
MNSIFSINSLGPGADLDTLREEALRQSDFGTRTLWLHILNYIAFPGHEWFATAAQFSVDEEYRRSVEISVHHQSHHAPVLFWSGQPPYGDIADVEAQALSAGLRRLAESDRDGIWVITAIGPRAKLWILSRNRPYELIPVWPRTFVEESLFEDGNYISPTDSIDSHSWDELSQCYEDADEYYYKDLDWNVAMGMGLGSAVYRRRCREQQREEHGDGYLDIKGNMSAYEDMFALVRNHPYPNDDFVQNLIS